MKKKILFIIIGAIILIGAATVYFLYFYDNRTDAQKFSDEYTSVSEDNIFVYKTSGEIVDILENGTGVVFLGFPECPWCQAYAPYLNDVAKKVGMTQIYYLNIRSIRENNTSDYKKIVELLGNNLLYDEEGKHRVFVPDITVVKDGVVIGHNNQTSVVSDEDGTPKEYWTEERVLTLKSELTEMIEKVAPTTCTTCE